jgi:superfamily I DNA/RNA helicase
MLDLPDFDTLSEEHDDILTLPLDASCLVTGPPGTGKTVMAIYRASILHRSGRKPLLLMYGRLLASYTRAAIGKLEIDGAVSTYHSWFSQFWRRCYGGKPPESRPWVFEWSACLDKIITDPPPTSERRHFLIDEGQDMPPDFYLLLKLISESLTVFADENQRITDQQSTLAEIRAATGIREVLKLTRNYRNTRPIAEFAASFYAGLPSGIPELPPKSVRGERPFLMAHGKLHQTIDFIRNYENNHRDHSIGILLERKQQVKQFYNRLQAKTRNPVQVYLSQDGSDASMYPQVDFAGPGIKLLTYWSAKGLEFDTVFLPELQEITGNPQADDLRMRFYVMSSRAKKVLGLMYSGEGVPRFVQGLPLALMEDRRQ